jgi:hypothetical protein
VPNQPHGRFDVFISYSHGDTDVVLAIDTALRVNGLRVFLDRRDIALGDALTEAVFEGIASASTQLVVLSERSASSRWVRDEFHAGRSRQIEGGFRVIPVLIESCVVPPALAHLKYLDLRDWLSDRSFRRGIADLLAALGVTPYAADDVELRWIARHATVLRQLELEFTAALGELRGGLAERLELEDGRGGTAGKYVLNDLRLAAGLLTDTSVPWPHDLRTAASRAHLPGHGCFAGGLLILQTWLRHTAQPEPGSAVLALSETIDSCATLLSGSGVEPWQKVRSSSGRTVSESLSHSLVRICEALGYLNSTLLRTAIPATPS